MINRIELMLEVCVMWLIGTAAFVFSLLLLLKAISYITIITTQGHLSSYFKVFIDKLISLKGIFGTIKHYLLKTSGFIKKTYKNRLIPLVLFILVFTVIGCYFLRFGFNFKAPHESWESTAIYFNNMLSPIIIGFTLYFIAKTFLEQKKFNSDTLFQKSVYKAIENLNEYLIKKPDGWLFDLLDKHYKKDLKEKDIRNNKDLTVLLYEERIYFDHTQIPPFLYHQTLQVLRAINKIENKDYKLIVFEEFNNSIPSGLVFMAYLQGLNVIEKKEENNKNSEIDKDLLTSLEHFLLESSMASDFAHFKSYID